MVVPPVLPDVLFILVVPAALFIPAAPAAPVAPVVLFVPVALRVASTALGEVRTTVAVSLRGTAFLVASAAACGVTPTEVVGVGWLAPIAGMVLVWAKATELPAISAVVNKIRVRVKVFMVKVSPVEFKKQLFSLFAFGMRAGLKAVAQRILKPESLAACLHSC